jgi:uncharacterized protein YndB with AHSA1/START domain
MPTVNRSAELPAPPEEIWDILTDPSRSAEWQTIHQGFSGEAPARLETGTTFSQKITIMGMPGEVKWTVATADAPSHLELTGEGPMGTKATAKFVLESGNGGGTKMSWENGFEGAVLAPMAGPLEAQTAKELDASLEKLKELVS